MRFLLSLTLAALTAMSIVGCTAAPQQTNEYTIVRASGGTDCRRFAQPGDTQIRIYCKESRSIWPVATPSDSALAAGYTNCRKLAKAAFGPVLPYCGTSTQWAEFDTAAIKIGVTCRWLGHPAQEICLDGGQWLRAEAHSRSRTQFGAPGFAYSGNTGWTSPSNGNGLDATAGSYGPFPAGGAIGQTFQ